MDTEMNDEDFLGTVEFSISAGLVPWSEPSSFVHAVVGKAFDPDGNVVGKITLRLVSATEAENQGVHLFSVCDADSDILAAVFATLFDATGESHEELDITPGWHNLLYVEAVEIEPGFEDTSLRVQLIETSITVLGSEGLIVAEEASLELTVDDWKQLGFRRIVSSPYVFRDQLRLNPYEQSPLALPDEASYVCDACGEEILVPLDISQGFSQQYVEDCPVCCRANVIHIDIDENGNVEIWSEPEQDN